MPCSWEDVRRLALDLPSVEEGTSWGKPACEVDGNAFVAERPLGKKDRAQLGDAAPDGLLVRLSCEHLHAKEALLAAHPDVLLTIPHFDGHAMVLLQLDEVDEPLLAELLAEAWLVAAPEALAAAFLAAQ